LQEEDLKQILKIKISGIEIIKNVSVTCGAVQSQGTQEVGGEGQGWSAYPHRSGREINKS
jgi:hypothetical protein